MCLRNHYFTVKLNYIINSDFIKVTEDLFPTSDYFSFIYVKTPWLVYLIHKILTWIYFADALVELISLENHPLNFLNSISIDGYTYIIEYIITITDCVGLFFQRIFCHHNLLQDACFLCSLIPCNTLISSLLNIFFFHFANTLVIFPHPISMLFNYFFNLCFLHMKFSYNKWFNTIRFLVSPVPLYQFH